MYLTICFVKEKIESLPIAFIIGEINKIRVVLCQEKAAIYIFLAKNENLGSRFTIFAVAFLAENPALFKLILANRSWQNS